MVKLVSLYRRGEALLGTNHSRLRLNGGSPLTRHRSCLQAFPESQFTFQYREESLQARTASASLSLLSSSWLP